MSLNGLKERKILTKDFAVAIIELQQFQCFMQYYPREVPQIKDLVACSLRSEVEKLLEEKRVNYFKIEQKLEKAKKLKLLPSLSISEVEPKQRKEQILANAFNFISFPYVTKTDLVKIGWSDRLRSKYGLHCDFTTLNPKKKNSNRTQLFNVGKVIAYTAIPEVKKELELAWKKRKVKEEGFEAKFKSVCYLPLRFYPKAEDLIKKPCLDFLCDWTYFWGGDLVKLLRSRPECATFFDRSFLNGLSSKEKLKILIKQPQLVSYLDYYSLILDDRSKLIAAHPYLSSIYSIENFTSNTQWVRILLKKPSLSCCCKEWSTFTGDDWVRLVLKSKRFYGCCDWGKITSEGWVKILKKKPELADRCSWEKLNMEQLESLLCR